MLRATADAADGTFARIIGFNLMAHRKQIEFDNDTFLALKQLGDDRMATLQELADEAFADLLRKHQRPVGLSEALKQSAEEDSNVVRLKPKRRTQK
jgi:hypothetical protein